MRRHTAGLPLKVNNGTVFQNVKGAHLMIHVITDKKNIEENKMGSTLLKANR